jgi:hypothetical protein
MCGSFKNLGSEVLTTEVMKSSLFWDITPCSPLKVNRRFGATCGLHLRRINHARNQHEAGSKHNLAHPSTLKMGATCSSETSADFEQTRHVISQKTELLRILPQSLEDMKGTTSGM